MKPEAVFRREMNRNYMVLEPGAGMDGRYAVRMLTENRIQGLLSFQEKQVDGERRFYYDITSRQPLSRILEHRNLNGKELERLMADLLFALKQLERYFLDENALCLEPEMLYVEPDSFRCFFCLVPGRFQDFSQGFQELSQHLLDHVNHRDSEAVVLAFSIFRESRKENFGMEEIEKCLGNLGAAGGRETGEKDGTEREGMLRRPGNGDWENGICQEREGNFSGAVGYRMPDMEETETEDWETDWGYGKEADRKTGSKKERSGKGSAGNNLARGENERGGKQKTDRPIQAYLVGGMILIPAILAVFTGLDGVFRYKWFLGAVEAVLAVAVFLTVPGKDDEKKNHEKDKMNDERRREPEEEPWEVYFREEEEGRSEAKEGTEEEEPETEFQTILLTARPVEQNVRRLKAVSGNLEIPLGYYPFLVGKSKEMADFCLNEPGVSRLHIKIEENDGSYTITDLNSTNGTRVNGTLLEANETCVLSLNSEVEIAGRKFWFQ